MKGMLDRLFAVIGALLLMQFPLFLHSYQERLSAHVDELQWQIEQLEENAQKSGKTLSEYILKFQKSTDHDFSSQGFLMQKTIRRFEKYSKMLLQLKNATFLTRPFIFIFTLQTSIFLSTLRVFEPGIPLTVEGLMYAFIGMCLGAFLVRIVLNVTRKNFVSH